MPPDQRWISAGNETPRPMLDFYSGDADYFTLSLVQRFTGENISANGSNVPQVVWYIPAGFTGFASGTAVGGSAMWVKLSATAAPNTIIRASARALTTSARQLHEYFDLRVTTGY
jgi:hypothetical protein